MGKPENSWKRWTPDETALLVSMAKQGIKKEALAVSFGRSEESVRKQLSKEEKKRQPVVRSKRIVEKKQGFWSRLKGMMS